MEKIKTLELKAIKHSEFASQETNCYQAKIYVNGKAFAVVGNAGHGGCDEMPRPVNCTSKNFDWDKWHKTLAAIEVWIQENVKPTSMAEYGMDDLEPSLEGWCGDQVTDFLIRCDLKRALNTKVLFRKWGGTSVFEIKKKQRGHTFTLDQIVAHIRKENGDKIDILNTMAESEALELYKATANA